MINDLTFTAKQEIYFITGNSKKAEQLSKYLNYPVIHKNLDLVEIQSFALEEVIEYKVKEAYQKIKKTVLVDDVYLVANSLGKLPGTFIKWFENGLGYNKFCKIVNTFKDKSATAKVGIGFYNGKDLKIFVGEIKGIIADKPKGKNGFGWDAIFIPEGYKETRSMMKHQDFDKTSPRKMALEKLARYLKTYDK